MKNKHRIRIQPTKKTFDFDASLSRIAEQYMQSERYLTPLIREQRIPPNEAVVLIATYTDTMIMGDNGKKEHWMSEQDIIKSCNLFIRLWNMGLFVPSPDYPYTLEETLREGTHNE